MPDVERYAELAEAILEDYRRLLDDYRDLLDEHRDLIEDHHAALDELDGVERSKARRRAGNRVRKSRQRDRERVTRDTSQSRVTVTRDTPSAQLDDPPVTRDTSRADLLSFNPSSLTSPPSLKKQPTNQLSSSLALSPWSGTGLGEFSGRSAMDLTTMVNGHITAAPPPAPPDYGISAEATALVEATITPRAGMSVDLTRRIKREVTTLLRSTLAVHVQLGLRDWYAGDENLHPGNIKYWVAKAGRGAPKSAKEQRLEAIQALKTQSAKTKEIDGES